MYLSDSGRPAQQHKVTSWLPVSAVVCSGVCFRTRAHVYEKEEEGEDGEKIEMAGNVVGVDSGRCGSW